MPEHQTMEYKKSWHDEFLEWICGYANAYGGTLYIGKNDNGDVVGLSDKDRKKLLWTSTLLLSAIMVNIFIVPAVP